MTEFELDWDRSRRTGIGEAVYCGGKSAAQIASILAAAGDRPMLLTRLSGEAFGALPAELGAALDYDPASRTAILGTTPPLSESGIGIVSAGTSDLPVAREAARTLQFHGCNSTLVTDIGVAGLWRLLRRLEELRGFAIVIAVAGMEGALFSVLSGLLESPIIAVPTSVGYGVNAGGRLPLDAALASCGPGVTVVNIDNGFGAACAALRIRRLVSAGGRIAPSAEAALPPDIDQRRGTVALGPGVWVVDTEPREP